MGNLLSFLKWITRELAYSEAQIFSLTSILFSIICFTWCLVVSDWHHPWHSSCPTAVWPWAHRWLQNTCRISPSPMPRWQQAHAAVLLLLLVQVRQAKQRVFLFFDPSVAFVECMVITDLLASLWKDFHLFAYRGLTSSSYAAKEISLCYSFKTLPVRKQCIQLGCIYSRVTLSSPVYLKKWSHQV